MFTTLVLAIATAWSAVVVDVIAESASSGGTSISLFGHAVANATPRTGVVFLAVLVASAAVGLSAALAPLFARRTEWRMAGELDVRWAELSRKEASGTRRHLYEWQREELDATLERLLSKRDKLLEEIGVLRQQTTALRGAALEQRASLERFATTVIGSRDRGEATPELIVIPEVDLGEDDSVTASSKSAVARYT